MGERVIMTDEGDYTLHGRVPFRFVRVYASDYKRAHIVLEVDSLIGFALGETDTFKLCIELWSLASKKARAAKQAKKRLTKKKKPKED